MVTGHVPHDADTMMGILTKQMYEDPIPPKVRVPQVSEQLEHLIMRCLEKKPEQRYQTMSEIEADLQRVHGGQRAVGPDTVTLTPTRPPRAERPRVSPIYVGGLGMAVVALVGTLAMSAYTERKADTLSSSLARGFAGEVTAAEPSTEDNADVDPSDPHPEVVSSDAPQAEAKAARAKPVRRKARPRSNPSAQRGQAILDPWK